MGLILSRKLEEKVIITTEDGREISVKVVKTTGKLVILDITAPPSCKVDREEIHIRKQERKSNNVKEA